MTKQDWHLCKTNKQTKKKKKKIFKDSGFKVLSWLQCYIPKWTLRHGNVAFTRVININIWHGIQVLIILNYQQVHCWCSTMLHDCWSDVSFRYNTIVFYNLCVTLWLTNRELCYPKSVDWPPALFDISLSNVIKGKTTWWRLPWLKCKKILYVCNQESRK